MECFEVQQSVLPYLDQSLPSDQAEQIRLHLNGCPFCRREAARQQQLVSLLNRAKPEAVPITADEIERAFNKTLELAAARLHHAHKDSSVILSIEAIMEQGRSLLQVLSLAGAAFAPPDWRRQAQAVRHSDFPSKENWGRPLEVDPIVIDELVLLVDIQRLDAEYVVRLALQRHADSRHVVEDCDVTWFANGEEIESTNTYEEGVAEFLHVSPGRHTFKFSAFPGTTFQLELPPGS